MSVPFVVDRAADLPLQRQIYQAWRAAILSGRFRSGQRVPSTRALAHSFSVARVTVSAAYDQLLAEGYFETRPGSGTFVSSELPERMLFPVRATAANVQASRAIRLSRYGSRLGPIER